MSDKAFGWLPRAPRADDERAAQPAPEPQQGPRDYVLTEADAQAGLPALAYRLGITFTALRDANIRALDEAAQAHGAKDSSGGYHVFAGTRITLP